MNPALISTAIGIGGSLLGGTGSEKETQKLPEENREANRVLLNRAVNMGQMPYMPYTGPQVAGFDPRQMAAMQNTDRAAGAFGLGTAGVGFGMGDQSSIGLFDRAMAQSRQRSPAAMDYYNSFFIDPVTGAPGSRTSPYEYIGSAPDGVSYLDPRFQSPFQGSVPQQNLGFGAPARQGGMMSPEMGNAMQNAMSGMFGRPVR